MATIRSILNQGSNDAIRVYGDDQDLAVLRSNLRDSRVNARRKAKTNKRAAVNARLDNIVATMHRIEMDRIWGKD